MLNDIVEVIEAVINPINLQVTKPLSIGLLLSRGVRTCTSIARDCKISHDVIQRIMNHSSEGNFELKDFLLQEAKKISHTNKHGYLIVDDSSVLKQFAEVLEALDYIYDTATGDKHKGYKIVLICWTDGNITLPVNFEFWLPEEFAGDYYKSKPDIAREMIVELKQSIEFDALLLDGLYASEELMSFFENNGLIYYMRLPRNRKLRTSLNQESIRLNKNPIFHLNKNNRSMQWDVYFGDITRYVAAEKRKKRNGVYETVYVVSNRKDLAKTIIKTYAIRWEIEIVFRSLKQTLGLCDCRARKLVKQRLHIYACLGAFVILEQIRHYYDFECIEDAYRMLQDLKEEWLQDRTLRADQYLPAAA